jgi:transcriptional regulator with XRE-family HTH domain
MTTTASDYQAFESLSVEHRRLLRQEELIVEVTEALARALKDLQITQSQLAARLEKTKGFVSQILGGGRNLTLRTLADVADALECAIQVTLIQESEVVAPVSWPDEPRSTEPHELWGYANCNDHSAFWAKAA